MKKRNIITFLAGLLATHQVVASPGFCPPLSMVKHITFFKAITKGDDWGLFTHNFNYRNENWGIYFTVSLKNAETPAEALIQGQNFYNHKVFLYGPINVFNYACLYGGGPTLSYAVLGFKDMEDEDENPVKAQYNIKF